MDLQEYINVVGGNIEALVKNNPNGLKIIDSLAEVTINGIEYQIQLNFEPNKKDWTDPDKLTLRKIVEDE